MSIFFILLIIWIVLAAVRPLRAAFRNFMRRYYPVQPIFDNYLDGKAFYLYRFGTVPCVTSVYDVEVDKAFAYVNDSLAHRVVAVYQSCWYNRDEGAQQFSKTVFVLNNKVLVELSGDKAAILFPPNNYDFAAEMVAVFSDYKAPEKAEDFEINIITVSPHGLQLKRLDIKPTVLDLALYYNDDFAEVDALIRQRLSQPDDKGIILLHGPPGTGKTTYLRYLIGTLKKKVLFVSPTVAGNLMNPEFIDLLIDNPNAVVIIEDAENIIMDRKYNPDSSVSNLLNLSDGLLSDCLSVQIICTFNNALSLVDTALLRKGRLIAKYEFGKLGVAKAAALSKHLGFDTVISQPMTLAEITAQNEPAFEAKPVEVVGFRRADTVMN